MTTPPISPAGPAPVRSAAEMCLAVRDFIRHTVIPAEPAPGRPLDSAVLRQLQQAARSAGVFAPQIPRRWGGGGLALHEWSAVFQEAGYSPIGPSVLNCMAPDEGNMHLLELVATAAQQQRYLAPLAAGTIRSCFGMTEPHPGAGSDPSALLTTAVADTDGWVINGEKRFISGADGAAFCIVMAKTDAHQGSPAGATMFLVDTDDPGWTLGKRIHAIDSTIAGGHPHVLLQNCRVPDNAVLGEVGLGFRYAQVRLGPARLTHCMRWLGLARRALDIALDRAEERELFGARLRDLGLAQELIASSVIDIETSDAIITKVARMLEDDPKAGSALSSVAKVHCSEAIYRVIDRAMQLCGGDGMTDALPLASYLNEVRPFRVYDGSTETQKWAIARRASTARRRSVERGTEAANAPREAPE